MLKYRQPTKKELDFLMRFKCLTGFYATLNEKVVERVDHALHIAVFDDYRYGSRYERRFERTPGALMLVIWDTNPYHCELFIVGKDGLWLVCQERSD